MRQMRKTLLPLDKLIFFCICMLSGQVLIGQQSLSDTIEIYPVTVIAIHPGTDKTETFELDYQDKMAHDAGALLDHIASISSIRKGGPMALIRCSVDLNTTS